MEECQRKIPICKFVKHLYFGRFKSKRIQNVSNYASLSINTHIFSKICTRLGRKHFHVTQKNKKKQYRARFLNTELLFNPQAPVAQKVADEVVFQRFQGEGVEFFLNRTSLTP